MPITDAKVETYIASLSPTHDLVQAQMERLALEQQFPIVGPLVGRLLRQLSLAIGARDVFEMGSGFGYSTLFFGQAVGEGGRVVHTDTSPARSAQAREHLKRAGLLERTTFEVGDALAIITRYPGPFDVVFIDVEKRDYIRAFELARVRLRPGGFIVTDNVLWKGLVADPADRHDESTSAIDRYNRVTSAAPDFLTTVLPIRDGLALHYKLGDTPRRLKTPTSLGIPRTGASPHK